MIIKEEVISKYLLKFHEYVYDVIVYDIDSNIITYRYVYNEHHRSGSIHIKKYLKYYRKYKLEEFLKYV